MNFTLFASGLNGRGVGGSYFLWWVGRGLHFLALAAYPETRTRVLFSVVFEAYVVFCESC